MRNSILPAASLSAILLTVFGIATAGRGPQRTADSAGPVRAHPKNQASPADRKRVTQQKPELCSLGAPCDDPVVKAGKLAKQEAADKLKETICSFLAEYDAPDDELGDAEKNGASKNDTYCTTADTSRATGVGQTNEPVVDVAVRPKVVLAVLPDPVRTQLALRFDEMADELQNSMQDLGWTYDRAWLPWDDKQHDEAIDFDERKENQASQETYETLPGVILFRGNLDQKPKQPLVVLVVGDTPTGGVNATSFRNAVMIWQQLTGWNNYFGVKIDAQAARKALPDASSLLILGPTYSGSMPSLKSLLGEVTVQAGGAKDPTGYSCPAKDFHIFIASGTVSDRVGIANLESLNFCKHLQVVPSSFAADLVYENERILQFLGKHLAYGSLEQCKVALVSEAESSFGAIRLSDPFRSLQDRVDVVNKALANPRLKDDEKKFLEREKTEASELLNGYRLEARDDHCHYYFPREISQLRAAYEQSNIFGFNSEANSVRTQLHLSLSAKRNEDDTIHAFSDTQGAAAMEAAMAALASDLERRQIRVVLLSATDVLDEIFVTRYLAQHAPNTAVIVADTDGLFLRGGDSSMQNAYVIGPWPLIPGNEDWSAPANDPNSKSRPSLPPVRIHNSAGGQGFYAAGRYLLCRLGQMPLNRCDAPQSAKQSVTIPEYQLPVATWAANTNDLKAEPPLWLSVVGRGQFWPISLIDVDQADDSLPESAADNLPRLMEVDIDKNGLEKPLPPVMSRGILEPDPLGVNVVTGIIALLLAFHGFACLRARLDRGFAWSYALSDSAHHRFRQILQIAITLSAVPALVLLKTRIEAGVAIRGVPYTAANWVLQIIALLLTIWPMAYLVGLRPWPTTLPEKILAGVRLVLGICMEGVFVFACNWWLWGLIAPPANKWPTERAFFFYRSGHLFSGNSPTLPILLLGGALVLYMVSLFERLVFYNCRIPTLPSGYSRLNCPAPAQVSQLNCLLSRTWDKWQVSLIAVVVILMVLCGLGLHHAIPLSLCRGRFDVMIVTLCCLTVFLLFYDVVTAATAWFLLRSDCLLPLDRSPLRWGFTWIKGWSWKRIWAPGAISPDRVYDYLIRILEANERSIRDTDLESAFSTLRQEYEKNPRGAVWANEVTTKLGEVHAKLAKSASDKLGDLQKLYSNDHGPITGWEAVERGMKDEIPLEKHEETQAASRDWVDKLDRMAKEEFIALLYLGYIRMVLLQIRSRILTATGMYLFLLLALTSYPFLNHHYVIIGLTWALIAMSLAAIWIYSQMHSDAILRRTTETPSGKLDIDFFVKILSVVGIPVLTLIASQFPEVSNLVFSWLEPGLSSMK